VASSQSEVVGSVRPIASRQSGQTSTVKSLIMDQLIVENMDNA